MRTSIAHFSVISIHRTTYLTFFHRNYLSVVDQRTQKAAASVRVGNVRATA